MYAFVKGLGVILTATVAFAQRPAKPEIKFDDPRKVLATESKIIPIYLCDLQGTEVTLPKGELLRLSTVGDSENWVVSAVAEDKRDLSIRPKEPLTPQTILNITSDHDSRYVFRLILNEGHCDSHVTLEGDQALQAKISTVQPWVSPDKYEAALTEAKEAKKQVEEMRKEVLARNTATEITRDKERADYPKNLSFDYTYDKKAAVKFGVSEIFHDTRFSYVKAKSEEPPVLFELKDGKPSLIEFSYSGGLYRTARIVDDGYLVRGGNGNGKHQEKLAFKRWRTTVAPTDSVGGGQ